MVKSSKGFTLVELIIVIAILGILAGVAVPAYSGYLTKANDAAVITELDAVKTAVQAANAVGGEITKITVADNGTTVNVTVTSPCYIAKTFVTDFNTYYGGTGTNPTNTTTTSIEVTLTTAISMTNSSYATGATWTSSGWVAGVN